METLAFLKHIEAELVGSRFKAILDGVHTFVADIVDHNPILTAAGLAAKEELMAKLPATAAVVANAVPAVAEVTSVLSDPTGILGEGGGTGNPVADVAAAVVKPAAEKAAVDAVDAALDGLTAVVSKRGKKAAAPAPADTKAE